jgi:hypothetical protein
MMMMMNIPTVLSGIALKFCLTSNLLLLLLLLLLLFTAIELSLGGSSPYSDTDSTNGNKYM